MTKTATCRTCGRTFAASRTGSTVHCPEHRRRVRAEHTKRYTRIVCSRCGTPYTELRCPCCGF